MTKGSPSFGKKNKRTHVACRRCGKRSYHVRDKVCSACGYGKSSKLKKEGWQWKTLHGGRTR